MNKISPFLLGLSLAVAGSQLAAAQENAPATPSIPKVLQITREFTKPGKGGQAHEKTEYGFIQAMERAKFPAYYLGMTSMSGKGRALFFTQYDSFETWEKDNKLFDKNPVLAADFERANVTDGELLDSVDSEVFTYDADLSYRPHGDISDARYMEISIFKVKPGHGHEFRELVKTAIEANKKGGTSAHWATFEAAYGVEDGTYNMLSADKSMAEIDTGMAEGKQFEAAMGEEGMKKFHEGVASAMEWSRSELFAFSPHMSYLPETWVKTDPAYWKPKAPAASAAKAAEKEKPKP
jgi:hypothetical protein